MNFKTTIILVVLLVVVGIVFLVTQYEQSKTAPQSSQQTQAGQGQKLLSLSTADVKSLSITDAEGKRTAVARQGETWTMTAPVAAAAVDWETQNLLRQIVDLRSQGQPASAPSMDAAGLNNPRYRVQIVTEDGKTVQLTIGNRTGIDLIYAQVDSGDINLIDASLAKTLKTAADDVRDKHLLTISPSEVKQIHLTYDNTQLLLAQVKGKWEIQQPQAMPGDEEEISSFLSTVTGIEASEFLGKDSQELAYAGFNHPEMTIWLSTQAPSTQPSSTMPSESAKGVTITVGAPDSLAKEHYLVEVSDGQYAKIDGSLVQDMKKTPLDLRDREALKILPADVTSISITKNTYSPAPTTQTTHAQSTPPLKTTTVAVNRRPKPAAEMVGPVLTTQPATQSATGPSTQPAPQSVWVLSDTKAPANDDAVDAVLAKFNPLLASKYLQKAPDSYWLDHYIVTIQTAGADHAPGKTYKIEFTRPANDDNQFVTCEGLTFQTTPATLGSLDTDFQKPPPSANPVGNPMP